MAQEKLKNSKNDWRKHKNLRKGGKKSDEQKKANINLFLIQDTMLFNSLMTLLQ